MTLVELDAPRLDVVLRAATLFLGSTGAMLMARAGIVHTSITVHFIFSALVYGYLAPRHPLLGLTSAFAVGIVCATSAFWTSHFNRRTYILVLYVCSLMSIPTGDLCMRLFPGPGRGYSLATPLSNWTPSLTVTAILALGSCLVAGFLCQSIFQSRQAVLLRHWSDSEPAVLRDLQIAGIFSWTRVRWAATPTIGAVSLCYLAATLFGSFARHRAYVSGVFDSLPFWMLLIGLAARGRVSRIILLVALFVIAEQSLVKVMQEAHWKGPTQIIYVVYGALFLLFSTSLVPEWRVKRSKQ